MNDTHASASDAKDDLESAKRALRQFGRTVVMIGIGLTLGLQVENHGWAPVAGAYLITVGFYLYSVGSDR